MADELGGYTGDAGMWQQLNDPEVLEQEDHYLNSMNETLKNSMGIAMIGDRDMEEERKHFLKSTMQVIQDIKKMRIDCYVSDTIYNRSEAAQTIRIE